MFAIFRIGLFLVCIVVVTANFEFAVKSLPLQYRDIPKPNEGTMDYKLVNENVRVRFERTDRIISFPNEMDFSVQTKRVESQLNNPRPKITPECNGMPGLYLKKPPKQPRCLPNLPFTGSKTSPSGTLFCYSGVNFQYLRDSDKKPVMDITAVFRNGEEEDGEILFIIMPVFVPPVEEAEIKLAEEYDVLQNVCPISLDQFDTEGLAPRKKMAEEKHHFVGDLTWLKSVLPRAKRLEGKNEWYYPGPIIIKPELYHKIIGIDYMFKLHAEGQEPVRHGPTPRVLKTFYQKYILGFH